MSKDYTEVSPEQMEDYNNDMQESSNIHKFMDKILKSKDTTKTGNLAIEEIGEPKLPLRTYKELSVFCREVAGQKDFASYFDKIAETMTASSLSKEGFFVRLAVTTKKEVSDVTPTPKKENKGWANILKPKKPGGEV